MIDATVARIELRHIYRTSGSTTSKSECRSPVKRSNATPRTENCLMARDVGLLKAPNTTKHLTVGVLAFRFDALNEGNIQIIQTRLPETSSVQGHILGTAPKLVATNQTWVKSIAISHAAKTVQQGIGSKMKNGMQPKFYNKYSLRLLPNWMIVAMRLKQTRCFIGQNNMNNSRLSSAKIT